MRRSRGPILGGVLAMFGCGSLLALVVEPAAHAASWQRVPLLGRRGDDPVAALGNKVVMFAHNADKTVDTWEWDSSTWRRRTPAASPPWRGGAAMVTFGNKVLLSTPEGGSLSWEEPYTATW